MPGEQRTTPASSRSADKQLLLDPLGFLRTEIYRQRVACNTLEALSSGGGNGGVQADAKRVLHNLVEDLPNHNADLEECLFPLLRKRVTPEDSLDAVLAQYRGERDREPVDRLVSTLSDVAEGAALPGDLRSEVSAFAEARRLSLLRENDVILPLAETRLTGDDLVVLGETMARRRGFSHPT